MTRSGFTIVELIITITIMGILMTLAVVNINSTQASARDNERTADIDAIQTNLESFYTGGISTAPTITNLLTNPSLEVDTSGYTAGGPVAGMTRVSGGKTGSWSLNVTRLTAGDAYAFPALTGLGVANATYSVSIWAKGNGTTAIDNNVFVQENGGSYRALGSALIPSGTVIPSTWTRYSTTFTNPSDVIANLRIILRTGITNGDTFSYDSIILTTGSTSYDYADGSTSGWAWTGTANASTSSGPAVRLNTPGTYPSLAMLSSPLLTTYLPDADQKSFQPPTQTDSYVGFIAATNAVQTEAGVLPQPTIGQYVYQPIDSNGNLCYNSDCRKYNLYYRLEKDNTVYKSTSRTR